MTGRIRVNITGMTEAEKAETLRQMDAAMAAAGFNRVDRAKPPKPARHLRAVTASGEVPRDLRL